MALLLDAYYVACTITVHGTPASSEPDLPGRGLPVVLVGLGTAVVFEAFTILATQDRTVRSTSPWQDDPYNVALSATQFMVPMLAVVIGFRLFAWRSAGAPDRARQTVRAVAAMTALIALTAGSEWAAVAGHVHGPRWNGWTGLLVAGLVVTSVLTAAVVVLLVRCRRPGGWSTRWRHDWLDDVALLCSRMPVVRRAATENAARGVRRHAMVVFVALSLFAALALTGAMAVGERWTDPLLTGWMVAAETAVYLAFCVIGNAIAGFVARPARSRPRRIAETAVVAGCVAVPVAVAFRDALWRLLGAGTAVTSVPDLVALTLGAGALTAVVTAATAALVRRRSPPDPSNSPPVPARPGMPDAR